MPAFASSGIPASTAYEALAVQNERVYYGEGSGTMAYTNLDRIEELDHPTDAPLKALVDDALRLHLQL